MPKKKSTSPEFLQSIKDWFSKTKEFFNTSKPFEIGAVAAILSQTEILKWMEQFTKSAASVYDKALDAEYLRTHIGGGKFIS